MVTTPPAARPSVVSNLGEAAGYGLVIAFAYAVWAPAALLVGGLVLILWANVRTAGRARSAAAVGAGFASARAAWRAASRPVDNDELNARRVA